MDLVHIDDPEARAEVLDALGQGWVVAIPTDTVYGLAADPSQPEAVERLFQLKQRPADVALPVLVASIDQAQTLTGRFEPAAERLAAKFWPGPLTLVVPRRHAFKVDLGGPPAARHTVGVRWPDHAFTQALCESFGPLAVTSANLHGQPPATTAEAVALTFAASEELAITIDGGPCAGGVPSTVVECRGPASKCLREGALPWEELHAS